MREDSIGLVVESLRDRFRTDPTTEDVSRSEIIKLEDNLFEIRARRAIVTDSLNLIEQAWIINNIGNVEYAPKVAKGSAVSGSSDHNFIFESDNVKSNLSDSDYQNLVKAEELERQVVEYRESYMLNYNAMLSLKSSYDNIPLKSDAEALQRNFDSLKVVNTQIIEQLSQAWGYIYDNKSFAYSILMEMLGHHDVLQQETDLMREAQSEISLKQDEGGNEEILRYVVQKSSMLPFEVMVAEKLGLERAADSLSRVAMQFSELDRVVCPEIRIEERLFLNYEPIKFVPRMPYNSTNPIPPTEIYERGTIYRIIVGAFSTKQSATTFRNTTPLSYIVNDEGRYCYYIGGFSTLEEAQEAQTTLKAHGFRAPEIVMWRDGKDRNITKDPIESTLNFRVVISQATTLSAEINYEVQQVAPNSTISKVGTDKFVITPLNSQRQADLLVDILQESDASLVITIEAIEEKIDF